jgi:hypothetical protein
MKELHIEPVLDCTQHYQKQWKNYPQLGFLKPSFIIDQTKKVFGPSSEKMLNSSVRS